MRSSAYHDQPSRSTATSSACPSSNRSPGVTAKTARSSGPYNGTAPIEVSSGGRKIHRFSLRGNRRLNHAIHMAAVTQIRHTHSEGRPTSRRRSPRARPAKKRSARSNASSATLSTPTSPLTPPAPGPHTLTAREGNRGTALSPARPARTPGAGSSDKPLPDHNPAYGQPPRHAGQHKQPRSSPRAEALDNKEVFVRRGPPGCGMRAVMGADAGDLRRCRGRLLRLVVALNARSPVIYPKERWAGAACLRAGPVRLGCRWCGRLIWWLAFP